MLRKLMYVFLIIFFILASVVAYIFISGANTARRAVAPVSELVQRLAVPATPVILPDPETIVLQINDLSRLETASFEGEKIITAERNQDVLWGALGESLIFVAYGKVIAGVDFEEMGREDLQVIDPDTVMVHLPPAQIFDDLPILDTERSYVHNRDTGLLTRPDEQLETEVRRTAEQELLKAARETELLARADYNAQQYMLSFLQGVGFENVIFTEDIPPTPPPFEQEVPKGFIVTPLPDPSE